MSTIIVVGFKIRSSSGVSSSTTSSTSFSTFAYSRGFNSAPPTASSSVARQDLKDDIDAMYRPTSIDSSARISATVQSSHSFMTPSQLGKRSATSSASTTLPTQGSIDAFFKRRASSVVPLSTKVRFTI